MPLASKLKSKGVKKISRDIPLWKGPCSEDDQGGITFSLLSKWLCCRERCRLLVVEGLKPIQRFNHRIEYGNMHHICEEVLASAAPGEVVSWETSLRNYAQGLCKKYPLEQEQILHWYNVCKVQFPVYVKHWAKHKDVKQRTPLLQEHVFKVPYQLPSGRVVILRGKWDSVDLVGPKTKAKVVIQENKTKGTIEEIEIASNLRDDLQSLMYTVALKEVMSNAVGGSPEAKLLKGDHGPAPAGIRYNVVRRPLSGGMHSIRQKQTETPEEFYIRLGGLIAEEPDHYFKRWNVDIAASDLQRFEQRFFIPVMEQLCDWWEYLQQCDFEPWSNVIPHGRLQDVIGNSIHYMLPHGVYNVLLEGGNTEMDEYLATGNRLGLTNVDKLFTELE